jgi:putative transposase
VSVTHVTRWQRHRKCVGEGHVYQGRYKSFPVECDEHYYQLVRDVERNPLRAKFVERCDVWRWSSLWRRTHGAPADRQLLARWPLPLPRKWVEHVQLLQHEAELGAVRHCLERGSPLGAAEWSREPSGWG